MPIIRWTPFDEFNELDKFFPSMPERAMLSNMPLNIYQTANEVVVESPVPGIDPQKLQINIENDVLTISGEHEQKTEVDEKNYYRREVSWGRVHRSVALPASVDGDKAKATYNKGVLKIVIPIQERSKPKQVKVEISDTNKGQ